MDKTVTLPYLSILCCINYADFRYLRLNECNQIKKTDRVAESDEIFLFTGRCLPKNIDAETILGKCSVYDFDLRQSSK